MKAALGFREHTGWAIAVAVGGDARSPTILLRERISLLDASLPRQVFHAIAEQGASRSLVEVVREGARQASGAAVSRLAERLRTAGHSIETAAVSRGRAPAPESLDRILGAHTLLHAAEGELYRDALCEASAASGLRVVRFDAREVFSEAAAAAGCPLPEFEARLAELRRTAGPPWQKDHREAAAAACLALSFR